MTMKNNVPKPNPSVLKHGLPKHGVPSYSVLMFPWLGHGHVSPFLELAKKLRDTNLFDIYLISTEANLVSVRDTLTKELVKPISLSLASDLPDLPPKYHTTNRLPPHLMPTLKQAFDNASPQFLNIMKTLKPDLLIYDMIQSWAPVLAASLGIPSVNFITTSATMASNMFHLYLHSPQRLPFPFKKIFYRTYENKHKTAVLESSANGIKDKDRVMEGVAKSSGIVLIKSFKEIEGKYVDYLSEMTSKKILPVGPLVADPDIDVNENSVIQWLETKTTGSTVFVSFGSEYFLSDDDLKEIAYGLESSNVNFIWVLRFPEDANVVMSEALPLGFIERVKDRGLMVDKWAPQTKILGHKNVGGFVSHCGWSSVMEAMKFGVPIIAMPMHLDQPVNSRLVVDEGFGEEVIRDGNGKLSRDKLADVIKRVVVSESGEKIREAAKKMSHDLSEKGEEEIDVVVKELLELCKSAQNSPRNGRTRLRKTQSETLNLDLWFPELDELKLDD